LFFPHGHFPQVPLAEVQHSFRRIFEVWGLPDRLRVDNGAPWGSCNDLPPQLALWVIGLGIDVHWNTPCRPQENGVIERSQGLVTRWGEPQQCQTVRQFQQRIDHEDLVQRERHRAIQRQPRLVAYPALKVRKRTYSRQWEQRSWDWLRVRQHLSHYAVARQVDCCGKIGHFGTKLYVGTLHKGLTVYVQFDPDQIAWIISNLEGTELRKIPAALTAHNVRQLTVHAKSTRP
jgi:hypothetical protein